MKVQQTPEAPVIIIGGGPTGLSLALGLARYKIQSILLEKKSHISEHSKAPVVHQRTREIFDQWGIGSRFLSEGNLLTHLKVRSVPRGKTLFSLDFNLLEEEAYNPGMLIIKQSKTERILLDAVKGSGFCDVRFGTKAISLEENDNRVEVSVTDKTGQKTLFCIYVAGCDGASGFVRESLKLPFPGKTYPVRTVLADVAINDGRDNKPWPRLYNSKNEVTVGIRISPGLWRLIHLEQDSDPVDNMKEVSHEEIDMWVKKTLGEGPYKEVWASPFKIHRRSSPKFRVGNIFLAGDAAHIHSPVGGQGMNAGIQDAHNLAWKLATVFKGGNTWRLLDSYETERREAVVDKVSGNTDFMTRTFLQAPLPIRKASFFMLRMVTKIPWLRDKFLRQATMINLGYSNSEITDPGVPSAGRRLPNVELINPSLKRMRLYELMPLDLFIIRIGDTEIPTALISNIKEIKIGPGNYRDPSGSLKKLLKENEGFILVRPDMHISWTGTSPIKLRGEVEKISGS